MYAHRTDLDRLLAGRYRPPSMPGSAPSTAAAQRSVRRAVAVAGDAFLPAVMLLSVLVVLVPVPAGLVDLLLAANLAVSTLALVGALAARSPLEMSVFPTFLLGATLVRLVLNISTTRLILTRAAVDGDVAAGEVVRAFGEFVSGNSVVVGAVIFAIIAVIQFVVITAGATRTGEVAARFALDGLPGRQMAIDTEVQAGTVTREQARAMRLDLQRHADFFANMDGASRFVRGEAVAGVVITIVNIVGGLAIGVGQHGMPIGRAIDVYSRLTIGDGLVSAVPSLLVSIATGLLISRSSQAADLSGELRRQFAARPLALLVTAAFLAVLAFTKLPFLPLAAVACVLVGVAWQTGRAGHAVAASSPATGGPREASPAGSIAAELLAEELVVVEVGRGLVHLVAGAEPPLPRRAATLRTALANDLGIVLPKIVFRDDPSLDPQGYRVLIAGELAAEGEVLQGRSLAVGGSSDGEPLEGIEAVDPAGGRAAVWIAPRQDAQARRRGAMVLDGQDVVARAVESAVRRHAELLLTRGSVSQLVEALRATQPAAVEGVVPEQLSLPLVHRTLQLLVRENVPIRPLSGVLELMADHVAAAADAGPLAEMVRQGLARTICRRLRDDQGRLSVVRLSEATVAGLVEAASTRSKPDAKLLAAIRRAASAGGERSIPRPLVVPGRVRRQVRGLLAKSIAGAVVVAEEEIADEPKVEVFATVGEELARAA